MKLIMSLVLLLTFGACASLEKPVEQPVVTETRIAPKELAYGGNCANGLCYKKMVKADPKFNLEYKNKIYQFSSEKARNEFQKNIEANIAKADSYWVASQADKIK